MKSVNQRQTKYWKAVKETLSDIGHATNAELLSHLQRQFPELSATTVHRVSSRMAERNAIAFAPNAKNGSTRYDNNLKSHDHFQCINCGTLIDTDLKDRLIPLIEESIDGCKISGRLTINGVCKGCNKEKDNENNNI